MNDNILNIKAYIEGATRAEVQIWPLEDDAKKALPLFITGMYQLLHCQLLGVEVCLLCCKNADVTPMQLKKHCDIVQDRLVMHTAVVLTEVKPYNQTLKPDLTDTAWLKEQWIKNIDKWTAAKKFADEHDMKFIIVTEKFFT